MQDEKLSKNRGLGLEFGLNNNLGGALIQSPVRVRGEIC
jgi:hypothetical protein